MSKDVRQFLQEEIEGEAKEIFMEMENDPDVQGLEAPDEIKEALFARIEAYEKTKEETNEKPKLTKEEEELMRLGRIYKRRRKTSKYFILAAVLIMALAVGMTSMGGPKKVFKTIVEKIRKDGNRTESYVDDGIYSETKQIKEDDAYELAEEQWGIAPVRFGYRPNGTNFDKYNFDEALQFLQLYYVEEEQVKIICQITPGHMVGSTGKDLEDSLVEDYNIATNGVQVSIKKYNIKETKTSRWFLSFQHEEIQYFIWIVDEEQSEIEKIVKNLIIL